MLYIACGSEALKWCDFNQLGEARHFLGFLGMYWHGFLNELNCARSQWGGMMNSKDWNVAWILSNANPAPFGLVLLGVAVDVRDRWHGFFVVIAIAAKPGLGW